MWKPHDLFSSFPEQPGEDALEGYLLSLLSRGVWTQKQVLEKLTSRKADKETAERLVRKYTDAGYLDDRSYALMFAETHEDWGCRRLRDELRRRGVRDSLIAPALEKVDEEARAHVLASEWQRQGLEERKIEGRLLRRGFSPSLCRKVARGTCDGEL